MEEGGFGQDLLPGNPAETWTTTMLCSLVDFCRCQWADFICSFIQMEQTHSALTAALFLLDYANS